MPRVTGRGIRSLIHEPLLTVSGIWGLSSDYDTTLYIILYSWYYVPKVEASVFHSWDLLGELLKSARA